MPLDMELEAVLRPPECTDPLRYVTWGSKSLQTFGHLEDRNLELYEEILKGARSRFELGKRFPRQ